MSDISKPCHGRACGLAAGAKSCTAKAGEPCQLTTEILQARIRELEEAMTTPPHGGAQVKLWMWNKTPAALDVLDERFRQISAEGWTTDHDDQHDTGEMAKAAATYALHSTGAYGKRALTWPWSPSWWKPTTPRHDLVKAAALIIAEIERIDRIADMAERTKGGDQ